MRPGDVRPRRVARDPVRVDAGLGELLAPVTQELHLVRSGRRPVEEVEEEQDRHVGGELADRHRLARSEPDGRGGYELSLGQHRWSVLRKRGVDEVREVDEDRRVETRVWHGACWSGGGGDATVALRLELAPQLTLQASPELLAFVEVLALPAADLEELVAREAASNPALELRRSRPAAGSGALGRDPFESISREPSAAEEVLAELRLVVAEEDLALADWIVGSLDGHGYCRDGPAEVAASLGVDRCRVEGVLRLAREVAGPGLAARDLRECLLLQLDALERAGKQPHRLARPIVADHLASVARGALTLVAAALGASASEVGAAVEFIRVELAPYPLVERSTRSGGAGDAPRATPDLVVHERDGRLEVEASEGPLPVVVDPLYARLAPSDPVVRDEVVRARSFLTRLERRQRTLARVGGYVVERQELAVREGLHRLKPLTRAKVAHALELHESTVSRAVAGKHVLVPSGRLLPLACFFDAAAPARQALAAIVATEERPLSDASLAERLAERGIPVARRTVAKYRAELGILPAALR
jgi:RNA polymerase sigma-54 factor